MLQGSTQEKEQASLVLQEVLEAARIVAVMLSPIVPALARLIYLQLGYTNQQFEALTWQDASWGGEACFGHAFFRLPCLFFLLSAWLAEWSVVLAKLAIIGCFACCWVVCRHCLFIVSRFACWLLWSDLPVDFTACLAVHFVDWNSLCFLLP